MATLYSVNKTKELALKPSNIVDAGLAGGKVRCWVDTYVGLGTESASDIIEFGPAMPVGTRVLGVIAQANGIGGTPDVGDYEDIDRYHNEVQDNDFNFNYGTQAGAGYEIDETYTGKTVGSGTDTQIIATLDAAVTSAGVLTIICFYTVE